MRIIDFKGCFTFKCIKCEKIIEIGIAIHEDMLQNSPDATTGFKMMYSSVKKTKCPECGK